MQALGSVLVGEADHALGRTQVVERPVGEEARDHLGDGTAQLAGPVAAPGRVLHEEGDLLGRVVGVVGLSPLLDPRPGLYDLAVLEQLDGALALPGVEVLADVVPGDRVQGPADLDITVRSDLRAATNVRARRGEAGAGGAGRAPSDSKTESGAAPSSERWCRIPATSVHHLSAAVAISASQVKSRPGSKQSRT